MVTQSIVSGEHSRMCIIQPNKREHVAIRLKSTMTEELSFSCHLSEDVK